METIGIHKSGRTDIHGVLRHIPSSSELLIICHGYRDAHTSEGLVDFAEYVSKQGVSTFSFTFTDPISIRAQVRDIECILRYFTSQGAYTSFALFGISFGALPVSIATHTYEAMGIRHLITVDGFFGLFLLGKKYFWTYVRFWLAHFFNAAFGQEWTFLKKELRPERITVPVLVVHVPHDSMVSVRQSRWFYGKVRARKELYVLDTPTADHGLSCAKDRHLVADKVAKFLK